MWVLLTFLGRSLTPQTISIKAVCHLYQFRSRIEPSVSISLQTSKSFSSQIPSKSSIQPKLDPIWVHQTLLDRSMTPQISPIKAICHLFQLGSRIEPSVSISLLINWPFYSQVPRKSSIKPKFDRMQTHFVDFSFPLTLQTGALAHKRFNKYILTIHSGLQRHLIVLFHQTL